MHHLPKNSKVRQPTTSAGREAGDRSSPTAPEGTDLTNILISDLGLFVALCYNTPRNYQNGLQRLGRHRK